MHNDAGFRSLNPRSMLFVPGDRPERFSKAMASGADCVCIDLEDAVAPEHKQTAREEVFGFLARERTGGPLVCLRINALKTAEGLRDLLGLLSGAPPDAVLLPKTESPVEIQLASQVGAGIGFRWIALIESAEGLRNVDAIALQSPDLAALMFGGADFSVNIGATFTWEALLYARQKIICAAALRSLPAIDVPFLGVDDEDALVAETSRVIALGFSCKSAIHPRQIAGIHQALEPSPEALNKALRILDAARSANGGVFAVDGLMVDGPVIANARKLLSRSSQGRTHMATRI